MVAPIVAAGAGKAAERAGKALTGDIYTRRWTTVRGAGRKKTAVEHELRVNPVSVGLGVVAAGAAALAAGFGLWAMQKRVTNEPGADIVRIVDVYEQTYKTVEEQVLVRPATDGYYTTTIIKGVTKTMWVPGTAAVYETVTTTVVDQPGYFVVRNTYGMPIKRGKYPESWVEAAILAREKSLGYVFAEELKRTTGTTKDGQAVARIWYRYHSDTDKKLRIGDREGFKLVIDV